MPAVVISDLIGGADIRGIPRVMRFVVNSDLFSVQEESVRVSGVQDHMSQLTFYFRYEILKCNPKRPAEY